MEPIRVMVVDDAADARFLIGLVLGDAADIHVVAEADGAQSALAALPGAAPDVVLVDARMPAVDGFELTGQLLARAPELRVALLTSMVDAVIESQARAAGAHACLSKGDMDGLADAVRAVATSA
jgi:DNA-binding NarL/FixJ family response regulator